MSRCKITLLFLVIAFISNAQTDFTLLPQNNTTIADSVVDFSWGNIDDGYSYTFELSTDSLFQTIVVSKTIQATKLTIDKLNWDLKYYWRVIAVKNTNQIVSCVKSFVTFNLKNVPNINLWLSASKGVKLDANGNVESWYNLVNLKDSTFQINENKRPKFIEHDTSINNQPTIYFDGASTELINNNNITFGAMYILVQWTGDKEKFGRKNGIIAHHKGSYDKYFIFVGGEYNTILHGDMPWNKYHDIFINKKQTYDYSPMDNYKVLYGETNSPAHYDDYVIGSAPYTDLWIGNITEIIAFSKKPNDEIKQKVYDYFESKYVPTVSLGQDVNVTYGFGDTILSANYTFYKMMWNTNDTTSKIKVNKSGVYSIKATNIFGEESYDTIRVTYPQPHQIKDTVICLYDTLKWNVGLKGDYKYLWSTGSTKQTLEIANTGEYWLTIEDRNGNRWLSDTINVIVDDFPQKASLGADKTLCKNNRIYLQSGFGEALSYQWSNGSTDNFVIVDKSGKYNVIVKDSLGCVAKDTINIKMEGIAPQIDFNYKNICIGDNTQFTDLTKVLDGSNIKSWEWDFGDGNTSTTNNPKHKYDKNGTYRVQLTTTTDNCSNSKKELITIYKLPNTDFSNSSNCSNNNIVFADKSTSDKGNDIVEWLWKTSENQESNEHNPSFKYQKSGKTDVSLTTITKNKCKNTLHKTLQIKTGPIVDFTHTATCKGKTTYFKNLSKANLNLSLISKWTIDGKEINTKNAEHVFKKTGEHTIKLRVTQTDNACVGEKTKTINVSESPKAKLLFDRICSNSPIQFTDSSQFSNPIIKYEYIIDKLGATTNKDPKVIFDEAGKYKLKYIIEDNLGCKDSLIKTLTAYQKPNADFAMTPEKSGVPVKVQFANNSFFNETNTWDFGDGTNSTATDTEHTYSEVGEYNVNLKVVSPNGCADSVQKVFKGIIPIVDLAVSDIQTSVKDNFAETQLIIQNNGTLDFNKIDVFCRVGNGQVIKEVCNKPLPSGEALLFKFSNKIQLTSNYNSNYICVWSYPHNMEDQHSENNETCLSLKDEFQVLPIRPNPVNDFLFVEFTIPEKDNVTVELFDLYGHLVKTLFSDTAQKGYNSLHINAKYLSVGTYICKISYRQKQHSEKIIVF